MKVLFDGAIYSIIKNGGILRYTNCLMENLAREHGVTLALSWPLAIPSISGLRIVRQPLLPHRLARRLNGLESRIFEKRLLREKPDIVHVVASSSIAPLQKLKATSRLVVTIHDMIPEVFRESVDVSGAQARSKAALIEQADLIVCVSQSTLNDLLRFYPQVGAKCVVIHEGSRISQVEPPSRSEGKHFLFVGNRPSYKNFDLALNAFAKVASVRDEVQLIVTGHGFSAKETQQIESLHLQGRVVNRGAVTDAELECLYASCLALLYPSLYEGFGLPPVEAMACGAPVLMANSSSLPEVAGNVGVLLDSKDSGAWVNAMLRVIDDVNYRRDLSTRGVIWAQHFSWQKMAAETALAYKRVLTKLQRKPT